MALFLMAAVTYGYALTSLGYYWSDWEVIFFTKLAPAVQPGFYAEDRPFPWAYQLINFLVGSSPLGWQIATLLLRWAGTLFFVYALVEFWPAYRKHFYWLGALLVVYPGFIQQEQSAAFSRHIMTLFLFTLSFYLMVLAIRRPRLAPWLFPLSWIATFLHLFNIEYFSGIEFIRPALIWMLLAQNPEPTAHRLRKVVRYALPYLFVLALFLWLRFVYFPQAFQTFGRFDNISSTLAEFKASFVGALLGLFSKGLLDLLYTTLQVWLDALIGFGGFAFQQRLAWFAFGLGAFFALAFAFLYNPQAAETSEGSTPRVMTLMGLLLFVSSALPIWAIGKEVSTGGWNERFTLAPMFGASLTAVGLVLWLVRPAGQKWILGALLLLSVATQVWIANLYRRDWVIQADYHWQLYWRIPALQPDTAVLSYAYPSHFITHDMDATWALNVLYHFQSQDGAIPYMFITPEQEIYFQPQTAFKKPARHLMFYGNTAALVAVLHPSDPACLRVLDTPYQYDPLLEDGSDKLVPLSNLARILPADRTASPDTDIFGPEPAHTWCYFFQKADLARQQQDWPAVLDLYQQAQALGFRPGYGAEYIPFIEAFAQTGDWQQAYDLTLAAEALTPRHKRLLCSNWVRLANIPAADKRLVEQIDQTLAC